MSFSYSSSVITQTGTDTSLSGLSGLTGVTVYTEAQTIYELDATRLRIDGTLSWNAGEERLAFINNPSTGVNLVHVDLGDLTITSTLDGETRNQFIAIDFGETDVAGAGKPKLLQVDSGRTASLQGTYLSKGGATSGRIIDIDGTATFSNGVWLSHTIDNRSQQIAGDGSVDCNDFIWRQVVVNGVNSSTFVNDWTNYTFIDAPEAIVVYANQTTASTANERSVTTSGVDYDNMNSHVFRIRSEGTNPALIDVTNVTGGNSLVAKYVNDTSGGVGVYLVIRQDVDFTFQDSSGSSLSAKIYGKDVDNGSRLADFSVAGSSYNFSGDLIYTDTGTSASFKVLTQVRYSNDIVASTTWTTVDNRGASDGAFVPFKVIEYTKAILTTQNYTQSSVASEITAILLPDSSVTESTKATVDAYSTIDTAAQFYDRAKSYLYDNYAGEDNTIVTREGATIDAGSRDVTIDATAGSAFAVDGSGNLTIKSSNFVGSITTTGTITLSNGATATGALVDTTGTSIVIGVNCKDAVDSSNIQDARVYVFASSGGALSEGTEIVNAVTGSSGDISERVTITPTQPATIRVRKGTSSTYYRTFETTASLDASGIDLNILLIRDE